MSPSVMAKAVAGVIAIIVASAIAYGWGAAHATARYELRLESERRVAAEKLARAEREYRAAEQVAAGALAGVANQLQEAERNARTETDSLRADLRAARVRLSVPVASCGDPSAIAASAASGERGSEGRAELLPETAEDLVAIGLDANSKVRQLNACVDAYDAVRRAYNELAARVAEFGEG